nr:regulatory iron-sulfur-containing complex subunit RicT [uncultured Parolsenella sp.]
MPTVIPVKFAYATRDLWFDPCETGAVEGDHVICSTERGTEMGLATGDPMEIDEAELNRKTDGVALKPVVRIAEEEDFVRVDKLSVRGDAAMPIFRRLVSKSGLDMKPVGVEYIFGGEKVVCYFSADERIDFRQLVRDLSRELHERVDMRQVGVREEAALVGGFGHCGQELCCARFGSGFEPVSIRMAKEQDLPLNSNKISGACGRLMCCLRYEFEAYRDFKQRAPKKNAVIQTPLGTAKIIEYDTPKEQLALRLENGKQIRIPLAEMETSDAARKKSEELGCPCRPDTVVRSTMDRLASPEVRAALEELDRKNGLLPDQTFSEDDLFVTEERGRRRRNKGGNKGGSGSAAAAQQVPAASEQPTETTTRKRRRRKTVEISGDVAERLPGQGNMNEAKQSAPGEGRRSRRRRHHAEGEAVASTEAQQQRKQRPQREDAAVQGNAAPKRRRRRPGDKGGFAAADAGSQQPLQKRVHKQQGNQPVDSQQREGKQQRGGQTGEAQQSGDAPKKRRRRRHRSGGSSEGGAPAAE